MEAFFVALLLQLSLWLGVTPVPQNTGNWQITQDWQRDNNRWVFQARLNGLECPSGHYLSFPTVVHGVHLVHSGNSLLYNSGDPDFGRASNFYNAPSVDCDNIVKNAALSWTVYSYSHYFSRFSHFPEVQSGFDWHHFFSTTMNAMAAGVLLVFALFALLIFHRRISSQHIFSIALGCICFSVYFAAAANSLFGLNLSMLAAHKMADIGLWAGGALYLNAFRAEKYLSARLFVGLVASILVAIVAIALGSSPDIIQFGTMIPLPMIIACEMAIYLQLLSSKKLLQHNLLNILSLTFFVLFSLNDILVILGITDLPMMLPIGIIGGNVAIALAVNKRIEDTYQERDLLLKNLEFKVEEKTKDLSTTLDQLKSTQAELIQSAKLASLGTMSAGIAHEINNSINFINGALKPLEKRVMASAAEKDKDLYNRLFGAIKEGTELTINIVKSLRNYTGLNQAPTKNVNLKEVVQSVLSILKSRARGVEIQVQIDDQLMLETNVVAINQILMNLLTNALDALDPEHGQIQIRASQINEIVQIQIRDNGSGIPEDIQQRIFEPFYTTKEVGKGTGLGMFIVQREMEKLGGQIQLQSSATQGTCFTLNLPRHNLEMAA